MLTIETNNGTVTIEEVEAGQFWFSIESDNGAHPNSPYHEDYYYEDGPFNTADEAKENADSILNYDGGF